MNKGKYWTWKSSLDIPFSVSSTNNQWTCFYKYCIPAKAAMNKESKSKLATLYHFEHINWLSQTLTLIFNFLFQFETQSHKENNNILFKGSKFFERSKSQVGIVYPSALAFETSGDFQVQVPLHSLVIHSTCNFGVLYFNIGWAPSLTKYPWMQNCKM